ncbi:dipeptidase [Polycladidibacter hongkongensis]|uniref:dipeptidase n=1 Tax=Polycladidibacter hongkongensis TaxID=1647556 RepID=UPI00082DC98A|nr:dipeptidase [Pseudovibrio hongkongensis]
MPADLGAARSPYQKPLVFDGHNDVLLRLLLDRAAGKPADFFDNGGSGHIDLKRARAGGLIGGLFACFAPPRHTMASFTGADLTEVARDDFAPLPQPEALSFTMQMIAEALHIEARSEGALRICRNSAELEDAITQEQFAIVLHMEGAEAIDADLAALEVLYAAGLRSLGPVWSRATIFGHGVPMRFGVSPDIGAGLSDAGRRLVQRCDQLGVLLDVSHLNEKGFWDLASISERPFVASHSNVHALTPHARNLTDKQLHAMAERGCLVGLNYSTRFLSKDGEPEPGLSLERMIQHIDYLLEILGEDGVALGSDFDGCQVPDAIGDAAGLPHLIAAMHRAGYGEALIEKIAHKNWLGLFKRSGF